MPHQPQLIPDEPTPEQAARNAERAEYLEKLRQKLQDPQFRNIEGFPLAEDEAILALSDPPYYTACPNPFLPEIIERWQAERSAVSDQPPEATTDGRPPTAEDSYHREPFAADVSEGKNDPIYNAHSYHTKVPHKAIMRYILHYTEPGDIVFDGFCGTGMTGVAAQLCGDKKTVQSLGYQLKKDGAILDEKGRPISRLGVRKAVLCDLSPAATFIAYNYNTPVDVAAFEAEARRILAEVEAECGWMYETLHTDGKTKGRINYVVWSEVFVCPECAGEIVFWNEAVDKNTWQVKDSFLCPNCKADSTKITIERVFETKLDRELSEITRQAKHIPVLIHYIVGNKRFLKTPDAFDLDLLQKIDATPIPYLLPKYRIPKGDKTSDPFVVGITHAHQFYTRRNLWALAAYADKLGEARKFLNISSVATVITKMYRFRSQNESLGAGGGPLGGTLYIPSLSKEIPIIKVGWFTI